MEEGGRLEANCVANKEEQIRGKGSREEREEEAYNEKSCNNDPERMETSEKQKEDSTNEAEKVISELTTKESFPNEGVRERRVCKDSEDKEVVVDEVDARPEKGQLKVEQTNFVPDKKKKKKGSEGVQLLTYFEAPPHLRFNRYVHGSYRPPMDVHGCLAR